jgi:hypothetical protein
MKRARGWVIWRLASALALLVALTVTATIGRTQRSRPNVKPAQPQINVEDKEEDLSRPDCKIWVLNFSFKEPRLVTVDIPGRGRRLCWYLKYEVVNKTSHPHTFIPDFELVTQDKPGVFHDQVLPKVQEAIRQIEDPTGNLDIKNSVTIAAKPIPPVRPDSIPRAVHGVAIWDDVNPNANVYSIFVSGLSNGWSLAEIPPDNKQIIRRKTLQLNFRRQGDPNFFRGDEIRFQAPIQWIYRATTVSVPVAKPAGKEPPASSARRGIPDLELTRGRFTPEERK